MVDLDALRTAMDDSGMTIKAIAQKAGISRETLYNKLSGNSEFTVSDIEGLSDTLHLSVGQRNAIFFK